MQRLKYLDLCLLWFVLLTIFYIFISNKDKAITACDWAVTIETRKNYNKHININLWFAAACLSSSDQSGAKIQH